MYTICTRPLSVQAENSRSCPTLGSSGYNGSLVIWRVVRLTAAKFKPLVFSVSGFALSSIANICIFSVISRVITWLYRFLPVTAAIVVSLLLLSVWQTDNSELCSGLGADCGVAASRKKEPQPWSTNTFGQMICSTDWTWSDYTAYVFRRHLRRS
jgi:hypothetical protein